MCAAAADRGFTWSDEETTLLLNLWGRNDAQSELTGNKRNFVVYEKISETMSKMGFVRTASQCREKIKRMKREYTITKQHNEKSGWPKKNMRFFEHFERILKEKQNKTAKNAVTKSSRNINTVNYSECDSNDIPKKKMTRNEGKPATSSKTRSNTPIVEPLPKEENTEKEIVDILLAPDVVLVEDAVASISLDQNKSSSSSGYEPLHKKRKLSCNRTLFKNMMDMLTSKFMKYQTDSDAKMLEIMEKLEKERHEIDENIKKMWLEFEERRSADETEHELNVMNAFQDIIIQVKRNHALK
ncbi:hypothetical protein JTE90_014164 [Oedothorax gibbosus]|uniref:Myb/SANT-like DNA-binding domain-containing protein n=1 Tax=Oedothorax gibbosus TaxID=931172 RepID=A0AAV6VIG9_9ARAC|nr:hypothetical protein JTE90_014164 [Oedothorax gibbosus]